MPDTHLYDMLKELSRENIEEMLRTMLTTKQWQVYTALEQRIRHEGDDLMDLFWEELIRHFPGQQLAMRAVGRHILDDGPSQWGNCCEGASS